MASVLAFRSPPAAVRRYGLFGPIDCRLLKNSGVFVRLEIPLTLMIKELVSTLSNSQQSNGLRLDADRLDSWKEIANYFRREVRTVQLWEKREGLPVHRHFHKQLGSVFAFRSELAAWNDQVSLKGGQRPEPAMPAKIPRSAPGHITIRVEPLRNETVGEQAL